MIESLKVLNNDNLFDKIFNLNQNNIVRRKLCLTQKIYVASANNTAFIVCLSVVVALIFIAVVCLLWWTEIKQRSIKELFEKFREGVRNFGNTISSNKPVKTVYSDKSKNFSGTEFLPEPAKAPTKEYTFSVPYL